MIEEQTHEFGVAKFNNCSIKYLLSAKRKDVDELNFIIDTIFEKYPNGMFFDEFTQFCEEVTSELFVTIFDPLYQFVPCV